MVPRQPRARNPCSLSQSRERSRGRNHGHHEATIYMRNPPPQPPLRKRDCSGSVGRYGGLQRRRKARGDECHGGPQHSRPPHHPRAVAGHATYGGPEGVYIDPRRAGAGESRSAAPGTSKSSRAAAPALRRCRPSVGQSPSRARGALDGGQPIRVGVNRGMTGNPKKVSRCRTYFPKVVAYPGLQPPPLSTALRLAPPVSVSPRATAGTREVNRTERSPCAGPPSDLRPGR